MYLTELYLENTGPISKCHVKPSFADNGDPLPIVIVGPNGSGKSIFLSYIVDALTEFAKQAFHDIVSSDDRVIPYFRIIHPRAIRSGESFSLGLLHFKANNDDLYYCEKSGSLDPANYSPNVKSVFASVWNWSIDGNHKNVSVNSKTVETEMKNGSHVFFPASRREDPDWLNPKSLRASMNNATSRRFDKELDKPLWVGTCAEENIPWILDVFLDSLFELDDPQKIQEALRTMQEQNQFPQEVSRLLYRQVYAQARKSVERILQTILQDEATKLIINYRNVVSSRISIKMGDGRVIPTFQSLSEGQSQLFHLFATIIRYGERTDLIRSADLSQITGLVIIDEVAAHLHPTLQHDVLPQLIKLFPKVQFIVSSHSPLFLLGMEKEFGQDKLDILELPTADNINSERYTEFGEAFEYYQATERFEKEIEQRFSHMTKPVVLTEGKLDVLYIQTALELLSEEELLNSLEIKPVGKEGDEGDKGGGKEGLNNFRKVYEVKSSFFHQPILLLYDSDVKKMPESVEKLSVKSIPPNTKNTKVKIGIENLLPVDLFHDCFYPEVSTKDGGCTKRLDKSKFCQWICEDRRNPDDFEKFKDVVEILKEFIKAYPSPADQQPLPQ